MSKQTNTSRNWWAIKPGVWAVLRGMVFFLLFTHQAWANIVCCGMVQFDPQSSCHQNVVKQIPSAEKTDETSHCHAVETGKSASSKPNRLSSRFTNPPMNLLWCCQPTLAAEPQPPIPSSIEQAPLTAAPAFSLLTATAAMVTAKVLSPPPKSRPIFLTVSSLLI